jgi:hypothetical protein
MSEFSDSFHLRTDDPGAAEALLRRADVRGAILLPVEGPFVAFLVDPESDPMVIANNTSLLVRYWFAEDYGCWLRVYDGPREIAALIYENEMAKQDTPQDASTDEPQDRDAALTTLLRVGLIDATALTILRTLDAEEPASEWGPQVAALLGLRPFAWLAGEDLAHPEQLLGAYPETRLIEDPTDPAR